MSWTELLAKKRIALEPTSTAELHNLRSIVARSLRDLQAPGLSSDTRFVLAYDAARTLSLMVVRAEGYRPKAMGGHHATFLALEAADNAFGDIAVYFDSCRTQRNHCEYDFAGGMSDTDAESLLIAVLEFEPTVEAWLHEKHPEFSS